MEVVKTAFEEDEYEVIEEGKKKKKKAKRDACYKKVKAKYRVFPSAYASGAIAKCRKVGAANWGNKTDEAELDEAKKRKLTSKPSSESNLGDWFKRKGAKGKTGGWVDCNAPDGDGGYKSCGRKEGEKRDKYPACRPTKAACKSKGKGKKWGKKSKNNENFDYSEKNAIFEETFNMEELALHNPGEKTVPNPVRESPVIPTEKPSPRRKKIWETKPAAKPKPKMEQ